MSFAHTTEQYEARQKRVTRRLGWDFLELRDIVNAVKKGMGLKAGEKVQYLKPGPLFVTYITKEPLSAIHRYPDDCRLEGFPLWEPDDFVRFFMHANRHHPMVRNQGPDEVMVNRIAFIFLDEFEGPIRCPRCGDDRYVRETPFDIAVCDACAMAFTDYTAPPRTET